VWLNCGRRCQTATLSTNNPTGPFWGFITSPLEELIGEVDRLSLRAHWRGLECLFGEKEEEEVKEDAEEEAGEEKEEEKEEG